MPKPIEIPKTGYIGARKIIKTAIKRKSGHTASYWLMRCSCGDKRWCKATEATKTIACFKCSHEIRRVSVSVGEKHGPRVIVKTEMRSKNGKRRNWCLMHCVCGRESWVIATDLKNKRTCIRCHNKSIGLSLRAKLPSNRQIGSRTIIQQKMKSRNQWWLLLCMCGDKRWVASGHARRHKACPKCQCKETGKKLRKVSALGTIFGGRAVIKTRIRNNNTEFLMKCPCGHERWVLGGTLRTNRALHCNSCCNVIIGNKRFHPSLESQELQQILDLHIYKKQSLKQLQEAR